MNRDSRNRSKTLLWQKATLLLFGLFLTLTILEIGLRVGGFILLSIQEYRNRIAISRKGTYRIMCLGESTTQGQYPPYLEEILNQSNIGIKFSIIDKGVGGINTGIIVSQLEANLNKYQPDLVVTMMGINDYAAHMVYEAVSTSRIMLFFKSLRVYKLIRLLCLHMITKAKETGFYKPQKNNCSIQGLPYKSQKIGLKPRYSEQDNPVRQEELFKKALKLKPKDDRLYVGLGLLYITQRKPAEAEQVFKKAIELNPKNDRAYLELGMLYIAQEIPAEAEQVFKKALELNPKSDQAYVGLDLVYIFQRKFAEAEQAFKKALELNPKSEQAYWWLGVIYLLQRKLAEAEHVFKKALELNPKNDKAYGGLATVYAEMGNHKLLEEHWNKANRMREEFYNPETIDNYRKLKQILNRREVRLVCVQYPVRSIEPLKKMFEEREGIIFVDNEEIFKSAIIREGYIEYFFDMFAGDFGHCSPKGNRLLAQNIANVILKEVFGK